MGRTMHCQYIKSGVQIGSPYRPWRLLLIKGDNAIIVSHPEGSNILALFIFYVQQ